MGGYTKVYAIVLEMGGKGTRKMGGMNNYSQTELEIYILMPTLQLVDCVFDLGHDNLTNTVSSLQCLVREKGKITSLQAGSCHSAPATKQRPPPARPVMAVAAVPLLPLSLHRTASHTSQAGLGTRETVLSG